MNEPYALSAENILASLPRVLREDANMHALAASISEALARRVTEIDRVSIYAHIDELPEELLDILEDGPDLLMTFDEALFSELVETITIQDNSTIRFRLINGLELPEHIERKK